MMESTPAGTHSPGGSGLRIAVVGKGGSGKTVVAATMTRILAASGQLKVLAIDADSAVSLPYALGVEVPQTVSDLRARLIEDPYARKEAEDRHVSRLVGEIIQRGRGFDLLAMGRPEGPGCYCAINDLLRYGIDTLSRQYDVTLMDCEAGPEQVSRRVVSGVELLLVVTDMSMRGVRVARVIGDLARGDRRMQSSRIGLVINRWTDSAGGGLSSGEAGEISGLEVLGRVPEDGNIGRWDAEGRPIAAIPASSPSVGAIAGILGKVLPGGLSGAAAGLAGAGSCDRPCGADMGLEFDVGVNGRTA